MHRHFQSPEYLRLCFPQLHQWNTFHSKFITFIHRLTPFPGSFYPGLLHISEGLPLLFIATQWLRPWESKFPLHGGGRCAGERWGGFSRLTSRCPDLRFLRLPCHVLHHHQKPFCFPYFPLRTAAKEPASALLLFSSCPGSGETRPSTLQPKLAALPERGGYCACGPVPAGHPPPFLEASAFALLIQRVTGWQLTLARQLAIPQGGEEMPRPSLRLLTPSTWSWEPSESEHSKKGVSWSLEKPCLSAGASPHFSEHGGIQQWVGHSPLPPLRPWVYRGGFKV